MEAEAAALSPALAELTRASNATISVVCSDALQRMDHDQDRAVEARRPGGPATSCGLGTARLTSRQRERGR